MIILSCLKLVNYIDNQGQTIFEDIKKFKISLSIKILKKLRFASEAIKKDMKIFNQSIYSDHYILGILIIYINN